MNRFCGVWIAIGLSMAGLAMAQSSANFQIKGGRVTVTQASAPTSTNVRADGAISAEGASGVAASMNFQASSGVQPPQQLPPELVFRNGFEN